MEELMIEIMHEGYVVKSDGASITIYASTLSKFNLDCTLRHAEEKLQHREPMRRRGRVR